MPLSLAVPPVVAAGGTLVADISQDARLQQRRGGRWIDRPLIFRVPSERTALTLRARGADGAVGRTVVVRVRPLTLDVVGDVNLGDGPDGDIGRHGPAYPWANVGATLRRADLAVANLECVVGTGGAPVVKKTTFQAPPTSVPAIARAGGIDVVSLANNHAGDFGDLGLLGTLQVLRSNSIEAIGAGTDRASALRPVVLTRLGLRVAFVGFSTVAPRSFAATPGSPGTAWGRPDLVRSAIRRAAHRSDVVVAFFHWGDEGSPRENAAQRALAGVALRAGASVVVGAHPHVLQPVRRPPSAVVAYSLGDFVFRPREPGSQHTGILHVALARHRVVSSHLQRAEIVGTQPRLTPGR